MQIDHPTYTQAQISAWLRGLMSVALADNDYSAQERNFLDQISHSEDWGEKVTVSNFERITRYAGNSGASALRGKRTREFIPFNLSNCTIFTK